jgi:enamine deaminase RidA (YjgF/YER057c/UK114 family)
MSYQVDFINPKTMPKPFGYTQVVDARGGRTVYIAGQVSLDAEGQVVGKDDFEAQARQMFQNIQAGLESVGLNFNHVVKLGIFITDFSHRATLRKVRDEFVNTQHPPASTLVQVSALFMPELMVEADAIAVAAE